VRAKAESVKAMRLKNFQSDERGAALMEFAIASTLLCAAPRSSL
jgi:Flp pilus assembly protein TadG